MGRVVDAYMQRERQIQRLRAKADRAIVHGDRDSANRIEHEISNLAQINGMHKDTVLRIHATSIALPRLASVGR